MTFSVLIVLYILGGIASAFLSVLSDEDLFWKAIGVILWPLTIAAMLVVLTLLFVADRVAHAVYSRRGRY